VPTTNTGENGEVKNCIARADAFSRSRHRVRASADLVLLAWALCIRHEGMIKALGLDLDRAATSRPVLLQRSVPKVFAAGDMRRGQSLVVWAIREAAANAPAIGKFLMGATALPR
jgi:glutamate synthase (NADPH/NADH) small chain